MLRPSVLALVASLMIFGSAAFSQETPKPGMPGTWPEQAGPAAPADPAMTGGTAVTGGTARTRAPAAARPAPPPAVSRQARPRRSYRSCLRRSKELRALRGAQRRAFITRCQLGIRRPR
ncbi:MAG TPA: hypothetical protein VHN20_01395 [Beijerinckiaceae bacterium]|nr:hypothetical protein [Beijerinckiaceae bacterium]